MQRELTSSRILTLDIARFYAMALVFYGHFIERVMYLHNATAALQYKFIYSFHMVAFLGWPAMWPRKAICRCLLSK